MISAAELKTLLCYDPETGLFLRLISRSPNAKAGDNAGAVDRYGYVWISINRRRYSAHRLAWFYMTGGWPSEMIDHRDGDKSNNRFENLRPASRSQNAANSRARNSAGLKGVSFDKRTSKWGASIRKGGRFTWLGTFETPEAAHAAYVAASVHVHGEFARAA